MLHTGEDPVLIGVTGCQRDNNGQVIYTVGRKYILSVAECSGVIPVMLPPIGDRRNGGALDIAGLLSRLDGLMVTGSPSNVEPHHYNGPPSRDGTLHDPARDGTTLPLIRAAIEMGLPVLAICRGIQELNVAFGGTLHQHLQEVTGKNDHRMPQDPDPDVRYGLRHPVQLTAGGLLAAIAKQAGEDGTTVRVNSLHGQAIDRLADPLAVEAVSEDGVVEAVTVKTAKGLALGVQWHPEYKASENPFYSAIFRAFGEATGAYAKAKPK